MNQSTKALGGALPSLDLRGQSNETAAKATLLDWFHSFADSPADFIVHDDGYRHWRYSYRQIGAAARAFAARLRAESIGKGEKIVFWSENRPEWLVAFWGCLLEGVIVVPVDYRTSASAVLNIQAVVQARKVLVGDEVRSSALGSQIPVWRIREIEWLYDWKQEHGSDVQIRSDDIAEIVFTSGATAVPKGVIITHRNIAADLVPIEQEVRRYRRLVRLLSPLRFLNLLPLSHMFGQVLATFFPPMIQGQTIFMHGYSPQAVIRQVREQRAAFIAAVPKMLDVLRRYLVAEFPKLRDFKTDGSHWIVRRWRYRNVHRMFGVRFVGFVVGGAPLDLELERFWQGLGFLVVQGYGLTETAPVVSFNHPFHLKPGTVGKPLPVVELKIDSDGEIMVRGEVVTPGYFSAPAEASKAFEDGWFRTGDIGTLDQQGYLLVRGRKKEMIITPEGLKVFPEDVELVLNQIPGVRDSAVVGRERVHAVLVLEPGADSDEIVRLANARLENHQRIRSVSLWSPGDLPRTEGTGKLKRGAIQRWVDAGGPPVVSESQSRVMEIIQAYAPGRVISSDTTLDELGLSSLEQVELLVDLEDRLNLTIDEAAFTGARRLADFVQEISRPAAPREALTFVDWNRGRLARMIRHTITPLLVLPITHLCARIRVSGREYLQSFEGPLIFASNHQSYLDTAIILAALPRRWRYRIAPAMWKEFFDAYYHPERYPFIRSLISGVNFYLATLLFNAFPLPQIETGVRESIRHIGELVDEGWSILIFPEGERTSTGEIRSFRAGVAMVGSRLRVPVVPVRLRGVERVLGRDSRMIHPGPVEVNFGSAILLQGENYTKLAHQVEAAVRAL